MTIMASGPPEAFERADPVLWAIATRVFRLRDAPGAGSRMSLSTSISPGSTSPPRPRPWCWRSAWASTRTG